MGDKTNIEWTDSSWNPIRGCSRVSEGCMNCYAETIAKRFSGEGQPYEGLIAKGGQWNGNIMIVDHILDQPLRWKKPRKIFVNSTSDLFHENVTDEQIDRIFAVMALSPQHTFQVLTKRPERMLEYLTGHAAGGRHIWAEGQKIKMPRGQHKPDPDWPLPNVWLGVSVEDQKAADERIPLLMKTPAAIRFLSCEPLLGQIDLGYNDTCDHKYYSCTDIGCWSGLDWVIAGGESGPGARPMHPDWVRSLRDQCKAAGVPFFFKQWGDWYPREFRNWVHKQDHLFCGFEDEGPFREGPWMERVGKKKAGSMLDGEEIKEYPTGSIQ